MSHRTYYKVVSVRDDRRYSSIEANRGSGYVTSGKRELPMSKKMSDLCPKCGSPLQWFTEHPVRGIPMTGPWQHTTDSPECQKIVSLQEENKKLLQWVADLQSGMYVNCVYCGHRYGTQKDTPVSMAEVLKQHIEQCPQHPLSQARAEIALLTARIAELETQPR